MSENKVHILTEEEYKKRKEEETKAERNEFGKKYSFWERCYLSCSAIGLIYGFLYLISVENELFSLKWFINKLLIILCIICFVGFCKLTEKLK